MMELKILNSVLHGELKPWKFNVNNTRRIIEVVRSAKTIAPIKNAELRSQLSSLLQDYPSLLKISLEETKNDNTLLQFAYCKPQLPAATNPSTQYYHLLINAEALRIYNTFIQKAINWTEEIDLKYQVGKILNSAKVLAQQTSNEIRERSLSKVPDGNVDVVHYALYFLKQNLIALYFSIQETYKPFVSSVTTIEDFYSLDLLEPVPSEIPFEFTQHTTVRDVGVKEYTGTQETISFGFKEDVEKLKTVINQLVFQIDLINQDVSNVDELLKLFTAKTFVPGAVQIRLGCETKVFRYVVDKLKPVFKELTLANIERSKAFLSKQEGTPITANNLSVSGSKSAVEPKDKTTIDKIFKHLQ